MGTAVKSLGGPDKVVFLVNGALVKKTDRQSEMKAETLAESLKSMGVSALNLSAEDAALGPGMIDGIARLSGGRAISGSAADGPVPAYLRKGPFLIGGASMRAEILAAKLGGTTVSPEKVATNVVQEAQAADLVPILLLDGSLDDAKALAKKEPTLKMIVYRSSSKPSEKIEFAGNTALITPGDRGKLLLELNWDGKTFTKQRVIELGPDYKDDPDASARFKTYLARVDEEGLLDKVTRLASDPFAGSEACRTCHDKAFDVWKASAHSHALSTLEKSAQDRDPDCVGCHVVGLEAKGGFISRKETPQLADVGCESCHGPGRKHSDAPSDAPMKKVGGFSCLQCHVPDHSPGFSFREYWKRIQH